MPTMTFKGSKKKYTRNYRALRFVKSMLLSDKLDTLYWIYLITFDSHKDNTFAEWQMSAKRLKREFIIK